MRETRHEETKTRPPRTGSITWVSGWYYRALKGVLPISIGRCKVTLVGRLAAGHGRQVGNGLMVIAINSD
ncbi:hypothetical protein DSM2777_13740 [Obesumbacterium proteus]|nr:hypothetical protein DSM2777_13740 [Obesumbacterium proteus]